MLREGSDNAHAEPRCGAGLEFRRKARPFVTNHKFDRVFGSSCQANPDDSDRLPVVAMLDAVGNQFSRNERNRDGAICHNLNTMISLDLDIIRRDGVVKIVADLLNVNAEVEPVGIITLMNAFVSFCDR